MSNQQPPQPLPGTFKGDLRPFEVTVEEAPQEPPVPQKDKGKTVSIVALVLAIVGAIFAVIPGAVIIGWLLLPAAFVLSIVGLAISNKKGKAIWALVISILGTLIGIFAFINMAGNAVIDAFEDTNGETVIVQSGENEGEVIVEGDDQGTKANPLAAGTAVTSGDWTITMVESLDDAASQVDFSTSEEETNVVGSKWLVTYNGEDSGSVFSDITINYVDPNGNVIDGLSTDSYATDSLDSSAELYAGASTEGWVLRDADAGGVWRVEVGLFGGSEYFFQ